MTANLAEQVLKDDASDNVRHVHPMDILKVAACGRVGGNTVNDYEIYVLFEGFPHEPQPFFQSCLTCSSLSLTSSSSCRT